MSVSRRDAEAQGENLSHFRSRVLVSEANRTTSEMVPFPILREMFV
jgi:hypothetical protein